MTITVNTTKAPALALTPTQFSQVHFDLLSAQFRVYFNTVDAVNNQIQQAIITLSTPSAGTTGSRPSTDLQIGQQYFDTTINRPIWWDGTNWINAAGTVV
jgi:type II secretory pathway component PulK